MRALREVVVQSWGHPLDFALYSLPIGGSTKLAAEGEVPDRVIPSEGRWVRDSNTFKISTKGKNVDSRRISKKLAQVGNLVLRQPGQGTVWSQTYRYVRNHRNEVGQQQAPLGVSATSEARYVTARVFS